MSKNIFVVKCDPSRFSDNFSRKKNSEIINHYEIRQRLTNNDVFKNPPTDEIVNFQIIKKLNNFKGCRNTEFLFFYQDKINDEFIIGLKKFFIDSGYPIHYHLISESEIKSNRLKKHFNSFQIMDSTWT
jgi:hypothetical protein